MVAESYLRGEEKPVKELREKLAGEVKQCWLDCAAEQERKAEEKLTADERWNRRMEIVQQCHREWNRIKSSFLNGTGTVHASDVRMLQMKNYLQIRQMTELEEELKAQRVAGVEQAAEYMEDPNLGIQNLTDVSYIRQMSVRLEQLKGQIAACKKEITLLRADCERLRLRTGILVEEPGSVADHGVASGAEEAGGPGSGELRGPGMMGRMMGQYRKDREGFDDALNPETVEPGVAGEDDGLDQQRCQVNLAVRDDGLDYENR